MQIEEQRRTKKCTEGYWCVEKLSRRRSSYDLGKNRGNNPREETRKGEKICG